MLSKNKTQIKFLVKGINHAYANTLRRLVMSEVPTLAIEEVDFKTNNSILYDEIVAHRLGLVPLKTDPKLADEKTQVKFTLKAKGPGFIHASDIKSKDAKCKPVHPNMPIVKLLEKQEIQLEATATLGTGKEHMKWSPGLAFFVQEPVLKINNKSSKLAEFKDKYPPQAFDKKGLLVEKNIMELDLVDACDGVCEDIVKVEYSNTNFIFTLETWGQMDCTTIITTAIDIFNSQLTEFSKLMKK